VMGREDETRWEVKPFSASEETHASLIRLRGRRKVSPKEREAREAEGRDE
jgi:hypothetical protein